MNTEGRGRERRRERDGLPRVAGSGGLFADPALFSVGADGGGPGWVVACVVGAGWSSCCAFGFVSSSAGFAP